eukprot:3941515-Rhodomonas_salina.3
MVLSACIGLLVCYGVSGTDLAYGATSSPYNCTLTAPQALSRYPIPLRPSCTMSSTDRAYGDLPAYLLRHARY